MIRINIRSGLLTAIVLSMFACTNNSPYNITTDISFSSQNNFSDLDKEYSFSTKALTKEYLRRKLVTWLTGTGKGTLLVREITYAKNKYPEFFRALMLENPEMLTSIGNVPEVSNRKLSDIPFKDFLDSCLPYTTSCRDLLAKRPNSTNGVYNIDIDGTAGALPPFPVLCDMTTDGGGWTLVAHNQSIFENLSSTDSFNQASLVNQDTTAKLADTTIKQLALSGNRELLVKKFNASDKYILRYSDAEWTNWAANGSSNLVYDSKDLSGNWHPDVCNGHYYNLGFSTYSDQNGSSCPVIFEGMPFYYRSNHVNTPNGELASVFIR